MAKKQFKSESKRLLDLMINSIYTHKEIFLRELISNASDALDKQYYNSLTAKSAASRNDYVIGIEADKEARTLTISDNGCGMTAEELDNNLGTIAKSGSLDFKSSDEKEKSELEIIGQFGVGFYSAFMVSDKVVVESRANGESTANRWVSDGADGYTVEECNVDFEHGTVITLYLKENAEDEDYDRFLDFYEISRLVKKYSDYIRYPIMMENEKRVPVEKAEGEDNAEPEYETVKAPEQLNSMVPIWRKNKNEISEEEYNGFYQDKFYDYEAPLRVIHSKNEGMPAYDAIVYIPAHAPFNYYAKDYEKGLQLYSNGVMITEKCADLLPDYFSFAKGLVDSPDLSLNISRELLQHDRQLKVIARNIEKKIKSELEKMLSDEREKYESFFSAFGLQIKFGIYSSYGMAKDALQNLIIFKSSFEDKYTTLSEYVSRMKEEQKAIYYACGETVDKIKLLPQTEAVNHAGFEVLYLTDDVDEFMLKMMRDFDAKNFVNICTDNLDLGDENKELLAAENKENEGMLSFIKETLSEKVSEARFTNKLRSHPVCLTSGGEISGEMERILNAMPAGEKIKAQMVLEINCDHPVAAKLKELYGKDNETLAKYAKLLYSPACLISGITVENPVEMSSLICELMV